MPSTAEIAGPPLAISYIRISTPQQLHGSSLERQLERSRAFAAKHGLHLDEEFQLHDIGVSAFNGDNVSPAAALGKFLTAVESGQVPAGSYLIVESLDRISRQKIAFAASLFLRLLESGINIVTLSDEQIYRAGETDFGQLIMALVVLFRANDESEVKRQRVAHAWALKRQRISEIKLTRVAPGWLRLSEDRRSFDVIEERASIVKRIYEESALGLGSSSITRRLNQECVPSFGRSDGWVTSYVTKILKNRETLGEYQPHQLVNGRRKPIGQVIRDYFPAVIDEELYSRVQVVRSQRALQHGGRKAPEARNLFTHIVKCAHCGAPMHFINKGTGPKGGQYLICSRAHRGLGCACTSWRYSEFERSFLFFVREIELASLMNGENGVSQKKAVADRLRGCVAQIESLKRRRARALDLIEDESLPTEELRMKLSEIQTKIMYATKELQSLEAQRVSLSPDGANQDNLLGLIELVQRGGPHPAQTRHTLAARLRELIAHIEVEPAIRVRGPASGQSLLDWCTDQPNDAQVLGYFDAMAPACPSSVRQDPCFTVAFKSGSRRRVVVSCSDALRAVVEAEQGINGATTVTYFIRPLIHAQRRSQTEAAQLKSSLCINAQDIAARVPLLSPRRSRR